MTRPVIGSENRVKKRMNICSLGSGVGLVSDAVREVGSSMSESSLYAELDSPGVILLRLQRGVEQWFLGGWKK